MKFNFTLSSYLKILTIIALVLMLYPLIQHPPFEYVCCGDDAEDYKFSFLISKDFKNIARIGTFEKDVYPKLYHLTVALLYKTLGFSFGTGMLLIILFADVLIPLLTYKLSLLITKHREISLLSAFLSVITIFYIGGQNGPSALAPENVAMALVIMIIYLFISNKPYIAGLFLGMYMITHKSWPISLAFILIYALIKFSEEKKVSVFKPIVITLILSFLISLPYNIYLQTHLVDKPIPGELTSSIVRKNISPLAYIWLIWPPGIIILGVYACWKIYRDKKDWNISYKFIVTSFLIVFITTQSYFLLSFNTYLPFLGNITFMPFRVLPFMLYFLSVLSAYAIFKIVKGKKSYIVTICLIFMLVSVSHYWPTAKFYKIGDSEWEVIHAFQDTGNYSKNVVYNPLHKSKYGILIFMGGQNSLPTEDIYLILSEFRKINSVDVTYILTNNKDSEMNTFIDKHKKDLKEIYSNSEYSIYEFLNKPQQSNTLRDYADQYSYYYNNYLHPGYTHGIFEKPLTIWLEAVDTEEKVCITLNQGMEVISCNDLYDFKLRGRSAVFKEMLTTYGVKPSLDRFLWLYNHDHLSISPSEDVNASLILPGGLNKGVYTTLFLYDINTYVEINITKTKTMVHIIKTTQENGTRLSLKFFARSLEWVLFTESVSYPNIIVGVPYAVVMELLRT